MVLNSRLTKRCGRTRAVDSGNAVRGDRKRRPAGNSDRSRSSGLSSSDNTARHGNSRHRSNSHCSSNGSRRVGDSDMSSRTLWDHVEDEPERGSDTHDGFRGGPDRRAGDASSLGGDGHGDAQLHRRPASRASCPARERARRQEFVLSSWIPPLPSNPSKRRSRATTAFFQRVKDWRPADDSAKADNPSPKVVDG